MKKTGILGSMLNAYKSQFLPEREENLRMSMDGTICVRSTDGTFIGIDKNNELSEFPEALAIQIPVFTINKKTSDVKVGDIIKNKNSFSKVVEKKEDGTLKCLSFSGYNQNRKQIKNVLLGTAMTRVVMNFFNFGENNGGGLNNLLPLVLLGDGGFEGDTLESLVMMQALSGGNGGTQNILPFLLLKDGKLGGGDTLETLVMMQAFNGGNGGAQNILPLLLLKDGKLGGGDMLETLVMMQAFNGGNGTNPLASIGDIFKGIVPATAAPAAPAAPATEG